MKNNIKSKIILHISLIAVTFLMIVFVSIVIPVYAWLASRSVVVYGPISTSTSLYIGAGADNDGNVEDIKYLYFDGIDVSGQYAYKDYVFSINGEFVRHYKIQIASTTNNQFIYKLYKATMNYTERSTDPELSGYVVYTPQGDNATPIRYYIKDGGEVQGRYLNQNGEEIKGLNNDSLFASTYSNYNSVNEYAIPLYWQTRYTINLTSNSDAPFPHFYILRVYLNNKDLNDKETDVICISAKDFATADLPS